MRNKQLQLFWLLLPAGLGLLTALLSTLIAPNALPVIIQLTFPLVSVLIGLVFSGFAGVGFMLSRSAHRHTERLLQQQDEEQNINRRRFLQRLDHEFKNPLSVARAGIANVGSATSEPEREAALGTVTNQIMRLVRLTTDLRKIAELETRPLEFAAVDLTVLLGEGEEVIRERIDDNTRRIVVSLPRAPWPLPTITGDWDLLFLAFYNLVDNARKFSAHGDTIEIRAREETTAILIEVADTGMGIADADLVHVWQELYRGENGHTVLGSGLGLSLVKIITERHHGSIALASQSGQGTNVTVQLPKSIAPPRGGLQ